MEKGFNLFSALVAATLLIIGTVLISTLVSTEETIGTEINSMFSNYQLSDAASIARADALQSFNYTFREELQRFLTISEDQRRTGAGIRVLETEMLGIDIWEETEERFERAILLKDPDDPGNSFDVVLQYVAQKTVRQFPEGRYGRYRVYLSETGSNAEKNIADSLSNAVDEGLTEGIDFLEVIDCDKMSCDKGTFYFIFPLDKISPEDYEKLPRIVVKDLVTQEEVKFGLLPKTRLKIYIPLRYFKAVHESIKNLQSLASFEANQMKGDGLKLGFCDIGSCVPRNHPTQQTSGNWTISDCTGDNIGDVKQDFLPGQSGNRGLNIAYNLSGGHAQRPGVQELGGYVSATICDDFSNSITDTGDDTFRNYNLIDGLGLEAVDNLHNRIPNCPFQTIEAGVQSEETKSIYLGVAKPLHCSKVINVEASTVYKETNPQYIVTGDEIFYKIKMITSRMDLIQKRADQCTTGNGKCVVSTT